MVLDELAEQAALAAAEVEHAPGAACSEGRHDRADPLVVEADPVLDRGFLGIAVGLPRVRVVGVLFDDEPAQRLAGQVGLARQVAPGDQLALGVRRQPALAALEQLLDLGRAHPVVLLVVEDRDQDVQVREQVAEPDVAARV